MKSIVLSLFISALASAQNPPDALKQGEAVFSKTCATAYCHGPAGAGGGAPRIAARGFDLAFISNTVTRGVPGTAMSGFSNTLSRIELAAVVSYVARLNGIATPNAGPVNASPAPQTAGLSGQTVRGREMFLDAVRGFGRCSTCHEVEGVGIPVAAPIGRVPADTAALRALVTSRVSTATVAGESMPILMLSNRSQAVLFYDLTAGPPVLRNETPSAVKLRESSDWRHSSAIGAYNDQELTSILEYLRMANR